MSTDQSTIVDKELIIKKVSDSFLMDEATEIKKPILMLSSK